MTLERNGWKKVEVGNGHFIYEKPIDPEIQAKMPKTSRTFVQVGPIELIIHDIKKALHPDQKIPL